LPSVFTLGKEPFVLGKGFAECGTRQSPLDNIFIGKGTLPSAFYRGTRVLGKAFGKIFAPSRHRPLTVTLPSARPALGKMFFIFFTLSSASRPALGKVFFFFFIKTLCRVLWLGTQQSFFLFKKNTLASASGLALGKVFFFFF
jgi:hypothetical protein